MLINLFRCLSKYLRMLNALSLDISPFIQNENGGLDTSYLISEGYEDLGMEDEKHIFIKPKQMEKDISFYR